MSTLEDLYTPSKWARMPQDEVLNHHVKFVTEESTKIRNTVPCKLDIPYGELEREKFDIFGTDLPDDAPVYIHIHGGYWQEFNKELSSYMVGPLYKNGIKTVVFGYPLCPQVRLDKIIDDTKLGYNGILAHIEKSKKISVGGHSAGAHLAISLLQHLTNQPPSKIDRISNIFLIGGVYDLAPLIGTSMNEPLKLDETTARKYSPQYHDIVVANRDLKVHIRVGEKESPAFKEQSEALHKKLLDEKILSTICVVKDVDHFNIVENMSLEDYSLTTEILNSLKN